MSQRQPNDRYFTPIELVAAGIGRLQREYPEFAPRRILEPGCGEGAFLHIATSVFPSCLDSLGVDIQDPGFDPYGWHFEFRDFIGFSPSTDPWDLVITNPPYSLFEAFITEARDCLARDGLGMFLVRLGVLAGQNRSRHLWRMVNVRHVWVIDRRPKFVKGEGTDRYDYCFLVFDAGRPGGVTTFDWIRW